MDLSKCACCVCVGGGTIGDNVLIVANSFVNFDVPSPPPIVSLFVIQERLFHLRGRQKVVLCQK